MTRKKVDLTYITNDSKRKTTFKKRKIGLIKKMNEISTLCGIEACAIIYNPNDPQPEVWPSDAGVQMVLSRFRRMSELKQNKKMLNQESLLKQIVIKSQEQLKRLRSENRKKEMSHLIFQYLTIGGIFDNPSLIDLNDISWLIDHNLNEIEKKINRIQIQEVTPMIENEGERGFMHHVQGLESDMNTFQRQH
ncbi:agamous-like MADS-box protein AGL80 [Cajanus cajan]|uniref:Agamous-like MADS-box protein AGL80 n=1 Tax=Cajanus cajan TaxID=3821 RepID=A0A151U9Y8_CAJCA|nr:agamous-like MADS-box protein AGL80 [Cajanus cajan]KYP76092.1 Agamous-like MADS-box protein AGL80 [Cajanus cajan]